MSKGKDVEYKKTSHTTEVYDKENIKQQTINKLHSPKKAPKCDKQRYEKNNLKTKKLFSSTPLNCEKQPQANNYKAKGEWKRILAPKKVQKPQTPSSSNGKKDVRSYFKSPLFKKAKKSPDVGGAKHGKKALISPKPDSPSLKVVELNKLSSPKSAKYEKRVHSDNNTSDSDVEGYKSSLKKTKHAHKLNGGKSKIIDLTLNKSHSEDRAKQSHSNKHQQLENPPSPKKAKPSENKLDSHKRKHSFSDEELENLHSPKKNKKELPSENTSPSPKKAKCDKKDLEKGKYDKHCDRYRDVDEDMEILFSPKKEKYKNLESDKRKGSESDKSPSPKKAKHNKDSHSSKSTNLFSPKNERKQVKNSHGEKRKSSELIESPSPKKTKIEEPSHRDETPSHSYEQSENNKDEEEINLSQELSQGSRSSERQIKIMKSEMLIISCHEVAYDNAFDLKNKSNLPSLPDCCQFRKMCKKSHSASMGNQQASLIPSYEEEIFNVLYGSEIWNECLSSCRDIIDLKKYSSVNVLKTLINIILKTPSTEPLSSKAVDTFNFIINTHPPCSEGVRRMYAIFFISSLADDENDCRDTENINIFEDIINRITSSLHIIVDTEAEETERLAEEKEMLKRYFIVLKLLIELLEQDFTLYLKRNTDKNNFLEVKLPRRIILANVIWPDKYSAKAKNYNIIIQLLIKLIKHEFPLHDILIFKRLINIANQTFVLLENCPGCFSSNTDQHTSLVNNLVEMLFDESIELVISFIEYFSPDNMQFLLSNCVLKKLISSNNTDKLGVLLEIIEEKKWLNFGSNGSLHEYDYPKIDSGELFKLKMRSISDMDYEQFYASSLDIHKYYTDFKSSVSKYPLTECSKLKNKRKKISRIHFLMLVSQCLNYYTKSHKTSELRDTYVDKLKLLDSSDKDIVLKEHRKLKNLPIIHTCVEMCRKNFNEFQRLQKAIVFACENYPYLNRIFRNIDI